MNLRTKMSPRGLLIIMVALAPLSWAVSAHGEPLETEGPLQAVDAGERTITVMDIVISVPEGTPIASPSNPDLDLADLGAPPALPGRPQDGFLGGTAIVVGEVVDGVPTADDVFVEPAENVILGVITAADCVTVDCSDDGDRLELEGVPLRPLEDERMPADPPVNDFGFELDLSRGGLVGASAATEGYYGSDLVLHRFALEVAGGVLRNEGVTEVSITRARCEEDDEDGIELRVEGATHDPTDGDVMIADADTGTMFGTARATADVDQPDFGTYGFRLRDDPDFRTCPVTVAAHFEGARTTAPVE